MRRWSVSDKSFINVKIPAIIQDYNRGMGGVDLHDMLIKLYRTDIKWKRFYMRVFFHLLDSCVVNSWLLYRRHMKQKNSKHVSLLIFKDQIAKGLMMVKKENDGKEETYVED
ncbi:piggyBac transposable element-derived protein 4-like [Gordionus sp. m RMFG-2023]|uniref:piggyBac transposable element-derived protein 4-like n=1 Tax=Gordionus sp. m RMFG-2023 TaxID=3053472 RepID=UPI0031FD1BB6